MQGLDTSMVREGRQVDSAEGAFTLLVGALPGYPRIPVRLESTGSDVIAYDLETSTYGIGTTAEAALRDLNLALKGYHRFLRSEGRDRLGTELYRHLEALNEMAVTPRDANRLFSVAA